MGWVETLATWSGGLVVSWGLYSSVIPGVYRFMKSLICFWQLCGLECGCLRCCGEYECLEYESRVIDACLMFGVGLLVIKRTSLRFLTIKHGDKGYR